MRRVIDPNDSKVCTIVLIRRESLGFAAEPKQHHLRIPIAVIIWSGRPCWLNVIALR